MCGPEYVLTREVQRAYLETRLPSVHLFVEGNETSIWDQVLSAPAAGRVTFVQGAEKLRNVGTLEALLDAGSLGTVFTVFESADDDFPRVEEDGKKVLAPWLAVLRGSRHAQLIRCCAPSKEEDLVRLVASWWPGAGANFAFELLTKCGGSLLYVRQACEKAVFAGLEPVPENAELVSQWIPGNEFADYLIAGDKKAAMASIGAMRHGEVGASLGILSSRVSMLLAINMAKASGWEQGELAIRLKLDRFLVRKLTPQSGRYQPDRVRKCRELLAIAESAWKAGASEGVLEAVCALW